MIKVLEQKNVGQMCHLKNICVCVCVCVRERAGETVSVQA